MNEQVQLFLLQYDHAWQHPWESVQSALAEVDTNAGAGEWQAKCYRNEEREKNWPLPGTVHWHVAHLSACKRHYRLMIMGRPTEPPESDYVPRGALKQELQALTKMHEELRAEIATLTDAQLSEKVSNAQTLAEFITMLIRHDTWHASQIKMAQRLWRNKE